MLVAQVPKSKLFGAVTTGRNIIIYVVVRMTKIYFYYFYNCIRSGFYYMNNIQILDEILLSDNVKEKFFYYYEGDFKDYLDKILPQIRLSIFTPQCHPMHIYGVFGHILKSIEQINILSKGYDKNTRKILAYTMLFHDLGKPKCHIKRKLNGELVDSFYGHNKESAEIARQTLSLFCFDKTQIDIIVSLVLEHDFIINLEKNNSQKELTKVIKSEIAKLNKIGDGRELFNYLLLVVRADNMAKNIALTQKSLKLIDKIKKMSQSI